MGERIVYGFKRPSQSGIHLSSIKIKVLNFANFDRVRLVLVIQIFVPFKVAA